MDAPTADPVVDDDLVVLAQRLGTSKLETPWTHYFAALLTFLVAQESGRTGIRLRSACRSRHRALFLSWLWPCHYLPQVQAALKDPSIERLKALLAFFRGVAVAAHMQAGRKLRKELFELFGEGALPFTLVALAQLAKRPRCLTPRPPAYQAKDISDVELRLAWQLWRIAQTVHQELSDAFLQHGIARVCPQCGRLFVVLKRSYCSERCRKAYHDRKLYRRKKTGTHPE